MPEFKPIACVIDGRIAVFVGGAYQYPGRAGALALYTQLGEVLGLTKPALTAATLHEMEAHQPFDLAKQPMRRWDWQADYLNAALRTPGAVCACCSVTNQGDEVSDVVGEPCESAAPQPPTNDALDAARWRQLRAPRDIRAGDPFVCFRTDVRTAVVLDKADEAADAAIAIAAARSTP